MIPMHIEKTSMLTPGGPTHIYLLMREEGEGERATEVHINFYTQKHPNFKTCLPRKNPYFF